VAAASVAAFLARGRVPAAVARSAEALALAALLAWLVVFLQGKGFRYHHVPARVNALATLVVLGAGLLSGWRVRLGTWRLDPALVAGVLVMAWAGIEARALSEPALRRAGIIELAALIDRHAGHGDALVFSSSVDPLFPALTFTGAGSASPYSCLWLIAGHYTLEDRRWPGFPYRELQEMSDSERSFVRGFVARARAARPRVLLFETTPVKQSFGYTAFDFERYFRADPDFAAFLSNYRSVGEQRLLVDALRTFDVKVRRDGL